MCSGRKASDSADTDRLSGADIFADIDERALIAEVLIFGVGAIAVVEDDIIRHAFAAFKAAAFIGDFSDAPDFTGSCGDDRISNSATKIDSEGHPMVMAEESVEALGDLGFVVFLEGDVILGRLSADALA